MEKRVLAIAFAIAALSIPAWTQSEAVSAQLNGTVQDPNGTAVPGAKVLLSNSSVHFSREVTTGENGLYTFTLIPPGTYELRIEKPGFSTYVTSNVVLAVGQSSTLNAQLQLGNVNQVIEVTGTAPVLNTG